MALTRNLYVLDEVISALQTCVRLGWPSLFWLHELVISGEEVTAVAVLHNCWLLYCGGWDPLCIGVPRTASEWVSLNMRITAARKAAKNVAAAYTLRQPERRVECGDGDVGRAGTETLDTDELPPDEAAAWIRNLSAKAAAGSHADACWLLQAVQPVLCADTIWKALRQIASASAHIETQEALQFLQSEARPEPQSQLLFQAAALHILCAPEDERARMLTPPTLSPFLYERDWARLTQMAGCRAARTHPIPREALHKETTRGGLSRRFTNIEELREPLPYLPEGTQFWRNAVASVGAYVDETGALVFPSDEVYEAAYDEWFPDDIPDEWSARDQQQSHGVGCAETAPEAPEMPRPLAEPLPEDVWRGGLGLPPL